MEGRNVFILRLAPLEQDLTQEALEKDEIFVGWKEVKGLLEEGLSFDDFRERVKATYKIENNSADNFARSLWWFLKEMKPGDYVVVPWGDQFYVAEVVGDPYYDESHPIAAHRRPVRWLNDKKPIPRELASDALKKRLDHPSTLLRAKKQVTDILVADIEKVLEDAKRGETPNLARELRARMVEAVRQELTQGCMNPDRFEELVERMARAMGAVEVKRVPRGSDQGADVIADFQLMGGLLVTVGIQAKFYQPGKLMGKDAVDQLAKALRAGVAEMGLVITTGDVSEEAYQAAEEYLSQENLRIGILGGKELAELIVDKGLWSAFDF
jgi:predicted Mrr-cat superfamily restriction endonuclease